MNCENKVDKNPFYFWSGQGQKDPESVPCNKEATHHLNKGGHNKRLCNHCLSFDYKFYLYDAVLLEQSKESGVES